MAKDFIETKERIYTNADRTKVVPEDSPEAAFMYAAPGDRIPMEMAKRLGLVKPKRKAAKKSQNKSASPTADKAKKTAKDSTDE